MKPIVPRWWSMREAIEDREERAAIMELDGGLSAEQAEKLSGLADARRGRV